MVVRNARIACKQNSRRSIFEYSAANILIKPLLVVEGNRPELIVGRNERLITNASIQRQMRSRFPSILNVKSDVILAVILGRKLALVKRRVLSQHQICQRQPDIGAVERHLPG